MTDISQAAKERAVGLANEVSADTIAILDFREADKIAFQTDCKEGSLADARTIDLLRCAVAARDVAFAKYIDKVSAVAEGAKKASTIKNIHEILDEIIVKDADPLADALWGTSVSLKSNCERDAKELRNALAKAGYKIVKDEG